MPALDEFLNATAEQQVDLFESREVQSVEGGVKGFVGPIGFTVGGFWTKLKNVVSQGLVIDPVTGGSSWIIVPSPREQILRHGDRAGCDSRPGAPAPGKRHDPQGRAGHRRRR